MAVHLPVPSPVCLVCCRETESDGQGAAAAAQPARKMSRKPARPQRADDGEQPEDDDDSGGTAPGRGRDLLGNLGRGRGSRWGLQPAEMAQATGIDLGTETDAQGLRKSKRALKRKVDSLYVNPDLEADAAGASSGGEEGRCQVSPAHPSQLEPPPSHPQRSRHPEMQQGGWHQGVGVGEAGAAGAAGERTASSSIYSSSCRQSSTGVRVVGIG